MLERAAAADPGYESSHDHLTTPAYDAYDAFFGRLPGLINAGPLPQAWLDLDAWCAANRFRLGDAKYPNIHRTTMLWREGVRSLRYVLLISILWRAQEWRTRPEEEALWSNPDVARLLARASTWEETGHEWLGAHAWIYSADNPVAELLAILGERGAGILRGIESPRVRERFAKLAEAAGRFRLKTATFREQDGDYRLEARFTQNLEEGEPVYVALADRAQHVASAQLEIAVRVEGGVLADVFKSRVKSPCSGLMEVEADRAALTLPVNCVRVKLARELCVGVRGSGPRYFAPLSTP